MISHPYLYAVMALLATMVVAMADQLRGISNRMIELETGTNINASLHCSLILQSRIISGHCYSSPLPFQRAPPPFSAGVYWQPETIMVHI